MYTLDKKILNEIERQYDPCKQVADYLTDHPETGGNEEKAVKRITDFLTAEGYEVQTDIHDVKHSFLAVRKDRIHEDGPKAVIMCEYDALPEIGHACGHSMSCGVSLLAALAFNAAYPDAPIRIDIMGTPAEEYPGGKVFLTDAGAFDDYEFAAMAHMFYTNSPIFNVLACTDRLITFKGKNSHASAAPTDGLNALNAARLFMTSMDMWRQHLPTTSQMHGVIENGGELPSIVPDEVVLNYYFRALNAEDLDDLVEKAINCMQGAALCTGTSFEEKQQYPTYYDLYQNEIAMDLVDEIFDAMGKTSVRFDKPMGSTDAGNVDQRIPVFHPLIDVSGGKYIPIHHPDFQALMKEETGYQGLMDGGKMLASLVYRLQFEEDLLANVQKAHREYRGIK